MAFPFASLIIGQLFNEVLDNFDVNDLVDFFDNDFLNLFDGDVNDAIDEFLDQLDDLGISDWLGDYLNEDRVETIIDKLDDVNIITGNSQANRLVGDSGSDIIDGRSGADELLGVGGNDVLSGGSGDDRLDGGLGDDVLYGGDGNDRLFGRAGRDYLIGGQGLDTIIGGAGRDTFVLAENNGFDVIRDFTDGIDKLGLVGTLQFSDFDLVNRNGSTLLRLDGQRVALLQGVAVSNITAQDFISLQG